MKGRKLLALFALAIGLAVTVGAVALAQGFQPTYGSAVVDGAIGEWNLVGDFFSPMYHQANPKKTALGNLYMRYDCASNTIYALVVVTETGYIPFDEPDGSYLKIGKVKLVDGESGCGGVPPDFALVVDDEGQNVGFEASAYVAEGSYSDLNVHTNVWWGGESQTVAVPGRAISITIQCPTNSVGLVSFQARSHQAGWGDWGDWGGWLLMAAGGILVVKRRYR
jgi:hypothetical protein